MAAGHDDVDILILLLLLDDSGLICGMMPAEC